MVDDCYEILKKTDFNQQSKDFLTRPHNRPPYLTFTVIYGAVKVIMGQLSKIPILTLL